MVAAKLDPRISIAPAYAATKRKMRRPQHTFQLQMRPWQIQPFMIAPVLPGETLKNLTLQDRIVSDPLKPAMKLIGWWAEHFFFYVKHRDFLEPERAAMSGMMLDPAANMASYKVGAYDAATYTFNGGMDFVKFCLKTVVEAYFRDEGEAWDTKLIDGIPQAQIFGKGHNNWTDSFTLNAAKRDRDVPVPDNMEDLDDAMQHWMALRDAGLVTMDYEDFIRTYGVKVRQDEASIELHRPELIRYLRDWTYPTNVVEPTTGVPTSAAAWSVTERADKDRFFAEPGFIFGVTVQRPKVYMGRLYGAMVGGMDDVYTWLPAVLQDHYEMAFKHFAEGAGPAYNTAATGGYWVDIRDLFIHGDQFSNYNVEYTNSPAALTVPDPTTGNVRYAADADIDEMFAGVTDPVRRIRHDGVVSLGILGRQEDRTQARTL